MNMLQAKLTTTCTVLVLLLAAGTFRLRAQGARGPQTGTLHFRHAASTLAKVAEDFGSQFKVQLAYADAELAAVKVPAAHYEASGIGELLNKVLAPGGFKAAAQGNSWIIKRSDPVGAGDPVYNGNIARWRKFGNSLYLRLLLRLSGKAEVADTCIKKFQAIVGNQATYPLIDSIGESAILRWTGIAPYNSPYLAVREQDFRAPAIASFFIDHLAAWNDPRIDIPTYGTGGFNRWDIAPYSGQYLGVPSGYAPGANLTKKSYFYSTSSAATLMTEPLTGMILNYAEMECMMAEATAKGWISGSAEAHYDSAISAGI